MLRDATLAAMSRTLQEMDVSFEMRKCAGELKIGSRNSTILLRSLEEPERLRGTNLA